MPKSVASEASLLLRAWSGGDKQSHDKLIPLVYSELRRLAPFFLSRERADHTLQPTALVKEAYLRLIDKKKVQWEDRAHFFAVSSNLMRRMPVDYVRSHKTKKLGYQLNKVQLDADSFIHTNKNIIKLDDALNELADLDPKKAKVELRFLIGLSLKETAQGLGFCRHGEA